MKTTSAHLYTLHTAANLRQPGEDKPSPARLLNDQIERGFVFLRFRGALETDFCHYLRASGRISRLTMFIIAIVSVAMTPFIDAQWFGMPEPLIVPARWIQLGFMLPTVTGGALFCWFWHQSRALEWAMTLFFLAMVSGILAQCVVFARYDYSLPVEFVGVVIVGMFALGRIRFWVTLPTALLVSLATVVVEFYIVHPSPEGRYHIFANSALLVVAVVTGYALEYFIRWTWINGTLLSYLSRTDGLTGLLNRPALEEAIERAQAHARREQRSYALAIVDIDAFGEYNDHYGHQVGDAALRSVAETLEANARRPQDVCGRYGGEEFVLLWMGGDAMQMCALAEATRAAVEQTHIFHAASSVAPWVTVSIGLCYVEPDDGDVSLDVVLGKADRLLYEAKHRGRNQVLCQRFADGRTISGERCSTVPASASMNEPTQNDQTENSPQDAGNEGPPQQRA